ncbi:Amino acid transporter, transmembrane [Cynara cardunculus var. scolymus]|uniref:Amino acid transporter, transmembrane n=1 Tax=Cynara cardunculus var. scolymus TaxID=59895 RepID=A0A103YDT2_CYNCS|nr:Amino acid transporter, transmembrane [Cynara cardunculus var. scolymus]
MDQNAASNYHQGFEISGDFPSQPPSKFFDDDGRPKRTGTLWTASAHIITAVIGSGVLALAWATAQLGWVAGPSVLFLFSFVTYYCSCLLASCYRTGDPVTGKRNYTYMEAVKSNLGGFKFKICGFIQYFNLTGTTIGYTIAASISMMAIKRSSCFHEKGHENPCGVSGTPFMVLFGGVEILLSQIPDFHQISWLSMVAAVMSFTYSAIGLGLGIAKFAAFGDHAPGNLLTGFGFYDPFWLVDIANIAIVIHLIGAYQVFAQPLFAFVEQTAEQYFPESKLVTKDIHVPIPGYKPYKLNLFRLIWRSMFVCMTTIVAMLIPFFEDVVGILGAFGFWPLTVYFPIEMYITQKKVPKWSSKWISLQILSAACLVISVCAAAGSIAGVIDDLKVYKPFKTMY